VSRPIADPDVRLLAAIAGTLACDYSARHDPWEGSPFAWTRRHSSRRRGKIGEQLVAGFAAAKGLSVDRARGSSADRVINGCRVEIKFSTLWESGFYKFQQVRDQDYQVLLCLGVAPFDAHCWAIPKRDLSRSRAGLTGQHTGKQGRDTAWLTVDPRHTPDWLAPFGGRLSDAIQSLRRFATPR
jgi:hypothetical protein